jgi:hypothetical protein
MLSSKWTSPQVAVPSRHSLPNGFSCAAFAPPRVRVREPNGAQTLVLVMTNTSDRLCGSGRNAPRARLEGDAPENMSALTVEKTSPD